MFSSLRSGQECQAPRRHRASLPLSTFLGRKVSKDGKIVIGQTIGGNTTHGKEGLTAGTGRTSTHPRVTVIAALPGNAGPSRNACAGQARSAKWIASRLVLNCGETR